MSNQSVLKEVRVHLDSAIIALEQYGKGQLESRLLTRLENLVVLVQDEIDDMDLVEEEF